MWRGTELVNAREMAKKDVEVAIQSGAPEVAVVPQQARIVTGLATGELGAFAKVPRHPSKPVLPRQNKQTKDGAIKIISRAIGRGATGGAAI